MSTLILGQEFASPVTQTILPVAEIITGSTRNGNVASACIVGFYPLSPTEFTGLETSVALASGQVATTSVRLPAANGVQPEYLVARFSNHEANQEAWRGHPSFVPADAAGYYSDWIMPASLITYRHGLGVLVGALVNGLDVYTWSTPSAAVPPQADNGALQWAASVSLTDDLDCAFFDFNWVDLFQAKPPAGVTIEGLTGLAIVPTTQPAGLPFKSSVLQHPMIGPNNTTIYNTVRIIRLAQTIAPDDYAFGFTIAYTDAHGRVASTAVTLTLTVV